MLGTFVWFVLCTCRRLFLLGEKYQIMTMNNMYEQHLNIFITFL